MNYVASLLEKQGLIAYSRGKIHILDKEALKGASCSCYGIMEKNIDAVIKTAHLAKNGGS